MFNECFFAEDLRPLIREARRQRDEEVKRMVGAALHGLRASVAHLLGAVSRPGFASRQTFSH